MGVRLETESGSDTRVEKDEHQTAPAGASHRLGHVALESYLKIDTESEMVPELLTLQCTT
jgi:hypothetical protein